MRGRICIVLALAIFRSLFGAGEARADGIRDAFSSPIPPFNGRTLFPNWQVAPTSSFIIVVFDDSEAPGCTDNPYITGLTVVNYGTADGVDDITGMYFGLRCGNSYPFSGYMTMGYAGIWTVGGTDYPAWTWEGSVSMVDRKDPCETVLMSSCACNVSLWLYTDIGPCPTDGATVELGPIYNSAVYPPGGISDICDYFAPWGEIKDTAPKTIRYIVKEGDKDIAAPGDTINYSITVGRPGIADLTSVVVMDTLPPYTHVVSTGATAPDPLWAPEPGPPPRLRWTLPGGPTAGGRTWHLTFAVTVDWGNGETFEPGSGDVAAPEGVVIENEAQAHFNGTDCPQKTAVPPEWATTIRRFLLWKLGDNDMLFASSPGQEPDELVSSVFIKNASTKKTWWDIVIWDTVPDELDCWAPDCGLEDIFLGWTMTPTPAAAFRPGYFINGTDTLLTWRLDLPPGGTAEMRWKAKLKDTVDPNTTIVGIVNVLARGKTGIVGGTGHSGRPRSFAHMLNVILPTTYVSYVGYGNVNYGTDYALDFYPLNKKTQFALFGLEYSGPGFAEDGGVSETIGCYVGDCIGGFTGSAGPCPVGPLPGGGISGCRAERIPAQYLHPAVETMPFNNIYKVVSNSPLCWQVLTDRDSRAADHMTFAPSTTMTYTGLMHYYWRRTVTATQVPGSGDAISLISTGMDPYGNYDPDLRTTVHEFQFSYVTYSWKYRRTYELGPESQAFDNSTYIGDTGPWRSISSAAQLIVNHSFNFHSETECCCGACGHNSASIWPTRERGNVVVGIGEHAYGLMNGDRDSSTPNLSIGNMGASDAVYQVYRYVPVTNVPPGIEGMPDDLRGTSGTWVSAGTITTPAGLNHPANPYIWPDDGAEFSNGSTALFKVRLVSGGPIQIVGGIGPFSAWGHGAVLHAAVPLGKQTGTEFWLFHTYYNEWDGMRTDCAPSTHAIDVFCPRSGMEITAESEYGMYATYSTNGVDQCVKFRGLTNEPGDEKVTSGKTNYRVTVGANESEGDVIAMYFSCGAEKGFTAPFMAKGTRYEILAPRTVFAGQEFWITVVVLDATSETKTDYRGITSFTSTDPDAVIEAVPMDLFTYSWTDASGDDGVHLFINVTLDTFGIQSIIASDITDGSIVGLTTITVVAVDVKFTKHPKLIQASSGDIVQFKVCWSNYSTASATNFVITDRVPDGTAYFPEDPIDALCDYTEANPPLLDPPGNIAYSTDTTATMPPAANFTTVDYAPPVDTRWLRWTVSTVGVNVTGCVCFKVRVD